MGASFDKPDAEPPARVEASDIQDSQLGAKLGTLRDAIDRAKVREWIRTMSGGRDTPNI